MPVSVVYTGPSDAVYVPDLGLEVKRGESVEVPAEFAGRAPGEWGPRTGATPEGWPTRTAEDGSTVEAIDPGAGLLAQSEVWVLAPAASTKTVAAPAVQKEG